MKFQVFIFLAYIVAVSAKYTANLNYRSPSEHHPFLGISLYKVARRNDPSVRYIDAEQLNFTHGVASGDPYADSVILWTRCSPTYDNDKSNGTIYYGLCPQMTNAVLATVSGTVPLFNHDTQEYIQMSTAPVCVNYNVATDETIEDVVASGTAYTTSDIDYTIKVWTIPWFGDS